jgi:hypothetical protein
MAGLARYAKAMARPEIAVVVMRMKTLLNLFMATSYQPDTRGEGAIL